MRLRERLRSQRREEGDTTVSVFYRPECMAAVFGRREDVLEVMLLELNDEGVV